jgi:hypothetical protein
MKSLSIIILSLFNLSICAQTMVEESIELEKETRLSLDLPFADDISLTTWDRNEIHIQASVTINNGRDDYIFKLLTRKAGDTVYVKMDKDGWDNIWRGHEGNCPHTEIHYMVYFPASIAVAANTISGDYSLDYYGLPLTLKTISGDIDLTIPVNQGVEFAVKTISGEVYSDLDISYPHGKEGLKQLVGINVRGLVYGNGPLVRMQTISGNIFLRKGI